MLEQSPSCKDREGQYRGDLTPAEEERHLLGKSGTTLKTQ